MKKLTVLLLLPLQVNILKKSHFTYDEAKMAALGLTEDTVKQMIQASDLAISLGLYEFTDGEQAVCDRWKVKSVDDLKEMLIPVTPTATNPSPFVKSR